MLVDNVEVDHVKAFAQTNRQFRLPHPSFFQRFPYFVHIAQGDHNFTNTKLRNSIGYRAGKCLYFHLISHFSPSACPYPLKSFGL